MTTIFAISFLCKAPFNMGMSANLSLSRFLMKSGSVPNINGRFKTKLIGNFASILHDIVGWAPRAHQSVAQRLDKLVRGLVGRGCPPYDELCEIFQIPFTLSLSKSGALPRILRRAQGERHSPNSTGCRLHTNPAKQSC